MLFTKCIVSSTGSEIDEFYFCRSDELFASSEREDVADSFRRRRIMLNSSILHSLRHVLTYTNVLAPPPHHIFRFAV